MRRFSDRKMTVLVASQSPYKLAAVTDFFGGVIPHRDVGVRGIDTKSDVSDRPFEGEVVAGAINRINALEMVDADMKIAVEGGMFLDGGEVFYNDIAAVQFEQDNDIKIGTGHPIQMPVSLLRLYLAGQKFSDEIISLMFGLGKDAQFYKHAKYMPGFFSHGVIDREKITTATALKDACNKKYGAKRDLRSLTMENGLLDADKFNALDEECKRVLATLEKE
ncbi:MAG: DUF84 family protein [Firmicutes bacterium]|nr:DUF84 family protein [Bacillota bacterium]